MDVFVMPPRPVQTPLCTDVFLPPPVFEKAQKRVCHLLLVIEEGAAFSKDTADGLAKLLQQLDKTDWQAFLFDGNHND